MTETEAGIIKECLIAAVKGPFFPEYVFQTIIGWDRVEVDSVLRQWPQNSNDPKVRMIVKNVLLNLFAYPHHKEEELKKYISTDANEIRQLGKKIGE